MGPADGRSSGPATPLPEADDADRLEQKAGDEEARARRRGDVWIPDADVAEQDAPVVVDTEEPVPDAERIEPPDDPGYDEAGP